VGFVEGPRQPHRADRRGLGLDREVGEDVSHQRLIDQELAEGRPVAGVVDRHRGSPPQPRAHPDHAVEPGVVDHVDDRRNPPALLADEARPRAGELDLARGVGAIPELVL